jgi:hypothetical protein
MDFSSLAGQIKYRKSTGNISFFFRPAKYYLAFALLPGSIFRFVCAAVAITAPALSSIAAHPLGCS